MRIVYTDFSLQLCHGVDRRIEECGIGRLEESKSPSAQQNTKAILTQSGRLTIFDLTHVRAVAICGAIPSCQHYIELSFSLKNVSPYGDQKKTELTDREVPFNKIELANAILHTKVAIDIMRTGHEDHIFLCEYCGELEVNKYLNIVMKKPLPDTRLPVVSIPLSA
eukprot:g61675.t1